MKPSDMQFGNGRKTKLSQDYSGSEKESPDVLGAGENNKLIGHLSV
jgi:hypothetical protein